jgi:hypothetical protein
MNKRFIFELAVGTLMLIAILLFGTAGMAVGALYAGSLFLKKAKWDEREFQLFYKIGNITAGATLGACVVIFYLSDVMINGFLVGKNWLGLVVACFCIAHGAAGLIVFAKN